MSLGELTLTRVYDTVYLLKYDCHHRFRMSSTKQIMNSVSQKLYLDQSVLYFELSVWIFALHHTYLHYVFLFLLSLPFLTEPFICFVQKGSHRNM